MNIYTIKPVSYTHLDVYKRQEPVVVKKDIKGFIGNRIQQAVLRESLHIVASGAATYEDVEMCIRDSIPSE